MHRIFKAILAIAITEAEDPFGVFYPAKPFPVSSSATVIAKTLSAVVVGHMLAVAGAGGMGGAAAGEMPGSTTGKRAC